MNIKCAISNPIIRDQNDFNELNQKLKTALKWDNIDIFISIDKVIIVSASRRTFVFPKKCGIDWLVNKCVYVESL